MKKFIQKILLLLLLFFVIIQIPKWVLPPFWGNEIYDAKLHYLEQAKRKYNTFFIGTSRVNNGIDPELFDVELGKKTKTFNLGAPGSSGLENIELAKHLIEHKTLDVQNIFIELPLLELHGDKNLASLRGRYYYDFSMYVFSMKNIFGGDRLLKNKFNKWRTHTTLLIKNTFSLGIFDDALERTIHGQKRNSEKYKVKRGYNPLYVNTKNKEALKRRATFLKDKSILKKRRQGANKVFKRAKYPKDEFAIEVFEELIDMAAEQDINLYFVLYPKAAESIYIKSRQINSPKINKRIINLANPAKYNNFYKKEYSFDRAHLNDKGAKLLTKACVRAYKKMREE